MHLGTQLAVIHGELFALHLLVSVGTAVEVQQPRSYIPSVEVFSKTGYSASSEELYGLGTSVSIAKPATLVVDSCGESSP